MEYIVKAPTGRIFRVKKKNLALIPPHWKLMTDRTSARYYNRKTGKINSVYRGVTEIRNPGDVDAVGAAHETEFDLLFGRLSEINL
jgi:hypothetical protein